MKVYAIFCVIIHVGKLKENCDKLHPLVYSLLRWILASNRSHLKKLTPDESLSQFKTRMFICYVYSIIEYQYLLMSSPPEKEKKFQEYKAKYGSIYGVYTSNITNCNSGMYCSIFIDLFKFHGSALVNWHSIMRNGLRNMSGTAGQVCLFYMYH